MRRTTTITTHFLTILLTLMTLIAGHQLKGQQVYHNTVDFEARALPICYDSTLIDSSDENCLIESIRYYFKFLRTNRWDPRVCGCDSVTYISECWAYQYAGIDEYTYGPCPCYDSTIIDLSKVDSLTYNPVCGCDSVTYRNASIARYKYGLRTYKKGECVCHKVYSEDPYIKTLCTGKDVSSVEPVCGCDSITYLNKCIAELVYGIRIYTPGVCKCIDLDSVDLSFQCLETYNPVCGCDSVTYYNQCVATKRFGVSPYGTSPGPCFCKEPRLIDPSVNCKEEHVFDPVCGCDSVTYANACVAMRYAGVTSWKRGWCQYRCRDPKLIDTTRYCAAVYDPVCGCDSITYQNECVAFYQYGITSWTKGKCFTGTRKVDVSSLDFVVYPNPSRGKFYIRPKNISGEVLFELYNVKGALLRVQTMQAPFEQVIELGGFPSGIYLARFVTSKAIQTKKIIIAKD